MSTPATATTNPQASHGDRASKLIVATAIAIVLPTIFLALRLLARHVLRIRLHFDDWLIIIAWVSQWTSSASRNLLTGLKFFIIGLDISGCLLIEHGIGRHIETVSIPDLVEFMQIQYTSLIQYPLCITFTKLSIVYEYRRLFPKNHEFKLMTSFLIAIMILWCTAVVFTGIFICTPIHKVWNPWLKYGKCIDLAPFYYGIQIPNVVTDLLILLLPFREVQRLKLPLKQKFGVALTCLLWIM